MLIEFESPAEKCSAHELYNIVLIGVGDFVDRLGLSSRKMKVNVKKILICGLQRLEHASNATANGR